MATTPGARLRFFNSLGRAQDEFAPAVPGRVRIYSCGPTVYSDPHLGNMRPYVFSDTLRRVLEWKGYDVTVVVNITDVGHAVGDGDEGEDKVEVAARRERRTVGEITDHYTRMYLDDMTALGVIPADHYPRASDYVPQMIAFAERIDAHGYTYPLPSGLYFDTSRSRGYGRLALLPPGGQQETGRISADGKRAPADFAVWRADLPDQQRIMHWDSPWGPGVPGWHLECSVMSTDLLGDHFDIHTGGVDHREIHHVNEIAQSEAYLQDGRDWVPLWMHNEFLLMGGAKIAKSAGRMPLLRDLVADGLTPQAFRYFLLSAQYRSQLDLTRDALDAAAATLRRLVARAEPLLPLPDVRTYSDASARLEGDASAALDRLDAALSDDLNTPRALAELATIVRSDLGDEDKRVLLGAAQWLLGLKLDEREPEGDLAVPVADVERLVAERQAARAERDWATADRVRGELAALGVQVTDTPDGPVWTVG